MKFKELAFAATVALSTSGAWAEDVTVNNIDLSSGTAFFGVMHFAPGAFTDTFNFVNGPSFADTSVSVVTSALLNGTKNINFSGGTLNGLALTFTPNGQFEGGAGSFAGLTGTTFQLIVMGTTAGVGGGSAASYAGQMNVTPVPEPETYALMLAGLGVVGFMAARRKAA